MEFLKSAVASAISKGPLGAYSIGDRVDLENSIWTLNNATKREGNIRCSVFTFDLVANKSRIPIARNAVRKARTLHHPGVIKVIDTIETDTNIYIVTERLTPLTWYTKRKSLAEETLKWGLCSVAKTLKFINEEASSVHGCLRTSSIFAGDSGEWKVGGFDILSSMKDDEAVIYTYSSLVPDLGRILPPEVSRGNWDVIKKSPLSAVDSYDFALLVYECFSGTLPSPDQAAQARGVPPSMLQTYRRLLNSNPKARLSISDFLEQGRRSGGFFDTPLIKLTDGIDSLGLMSEGERDEFFGELEAVAADFPEDFVKRKILPELIKSVEFGGGGAKVLNVVLQVGAKLSEDEYETQLTPVVVRLFASPDRALRVCLLDNLPVMIDRLSPKVTNDKIFPNLVTGFTDQAPLLREQTVKSILVIIKNLSERTVNGELLRYLAKTANDAEPGIRTNTTICLGKIAKHLSKQTRSKVLIAAFTRSLRDPFIHARSAALMALAATADMFSEDDAANKLLPALCPSLIDKEKIVRDQANRAFDQILARVRKFAQTMPDTALPPTQGAGANGAPGGPRMGTPNPSGSDSGWAGWAISSFTNKLAAANGDIQSKANGTLASPAARQVGGASSSAPTSRPSSSASTPLTAKPPITRNATESTKLAASFTAPELTENEDLWGDMDDNDAGEADDAWGTMEDEIEEDENSAQRASTQQKTSSGTAATKSTNAHSATSYNDAGEPDFAGWLKAQQNAKSSTKPLPKGLGTAKGVPLAKRPAAAPRSATTGSTSSVTKSKIPAKSVAQPKNDDNETDEAWGDAWE